MHTHPAHTIEFENLFCVYVAPRSICAHSLQNDATRMGHRRWAKNEDLTSKCGHVLNRHTHTHNFNAYRSSLYVIQIKYNPYFIKIVFKCLPRTNTHTRQTQSISTPFVLLLVAMMSFYFVWAAFFCWKEVIFIECVLQFWLIFVWWIVRFGTIWFKTFNRRGYTWCLEEIPPDGSTSITTSRTHAKRTHTSILLYSISHTSQ